MTKLSIPVPLILSTTSESFSWERRNLAERKSLDLRDFDNVSVITINRIPREDLEELLTVAVDQGAKKFEKTLAAILAPGDEQGWKVPSIEAFQKLLADYIRKNCVNGWLWKAAPDGSYLPYAVTRIEYVQIDKMKYETKPHVKIQVAWWGLLRYKAEEAGSEFLEANTRRLKPSQRCPDCGTIRRKALSDRQHDCSCGCTLARDQAAALVLLRWGLEEVAQRAASPQPENGHPAGAVGVSAAQAA